MDKNVDPWRPLDGLGNEECAFVLDLRDVMRDGRDAKAAWAEYASWLAAEPGRRLDQALAEQEAGLCKVAYVLKYLCDGHFLTLPGSYEDVAGALAALYSHAMINHPGAEAGSLTARYSVAVERRHVEEILTLSVPDLEARR